MSIVSFVNAMSLVDNRCCKRECSAMRCRQYGDPDVLSHATQRSVAAVAV
jgi:hypothetical protein